MILYFHICNTLCTSFVVFLIDTSIHNRIWRIVICTNEDTFIQFLSFFFNFFFLDFYLFMIVTHRERERGRDTGRGRSRLHAPGARCGIRFWVSRITPWAKGRRQTAAPPRDPWFFFKIYLFMRDRERGRDIGRGRSRLHAPGARCGIRFQVSRIAPWAKGRR